MTNGGIANVALDIYKLDRQNDYEILPSYVTV